MAEEIEIRMVPSQARMPVRRREETVGKIRIKLVRSPICAPEKQKRVVKGLGLRKLNQIVERPDLPEFRGMVKKVPHLLQVVE
jgi:large subunit ribosomal protein L30